MAGWEGGWGADWGGREQSPPGSPRSQQKFTDRRPPEEVKWRELSTPLPHAAKNSCRDAIRNLLFGLDVIIRKRVLIESKITRWAETCLSSSQAKGTWLKSPLVSELLERVNHIFQKFLKKVMRDVSRDGQA